MPSLDADQRDAPRPAPARRRSVRRAPGAARRSAWTSRTPPGRCSTSRARARPGGAAGPRPAPRRAPARARYAALGLGRVALGRHQDAGQARLQQDLLEETLLVRGCRREHLEEIRDERRGLVVPTASVVEQPQTVGELSELLEVPLGDPVAPRGGEVLDVRGHPLRRGVALVPGELLALMQRPIGEVLGVRPQGTRRGAPDRRRAVRPRTSRIVSQHRQARARSTGIDLADEALLHQRAEPVEHVDPFEALHTCPATPSTASSVAPENTARSASSRCSSTVSSS